MVCWYGHDYYTRHKNNCHGDCFFARYKKYFVQIYAQNTYKYIT